VGSESGFTVTGKSGRPKWLTSARHELVQPRLGWCWSCL